MDTKSVSLVLPMYNEINYVEKTITKAISVLETSVSDFEIIIVYDASNDGSIEDNYAGVNFSYFTYNLTVRSIPNEIISLTYFKGTKFKYKAEFILIPDVLENIDVAGLKREEFVLLETFVMPDGTEVYLYKRINNG